MKPVSIALLGLLLFTSGFLSIVTYVDAQDEYILQVAVSVAPLGGIVNEIGHEYIGVDILLPEGIEPHAAQLPQDSVAAAASADLLVLTGHFPWEVDLVNQTGTPFITLEDYEEFGAELAPLPGRYQESHEEDEGTTHDHGNENLHSYWLLPLNAIAIANTTRNALDSLAPSYSNFWQASFLHFVEKVEGFQNLVAEQDSEYHFSNLVAAVVFPAEAYVAQTFGIEVRAILQEGENVFISGPDLLDVQHALSNGSIDFILASDIARLQAGGEFANQLAEDTETYVIWCKAIFFAGLSDYLSVMTYNLGSFVSALEDASDSTSSNTLNFVLLGTTGFLTVVVLVESVLLIQRIRKDE